MILREFILENSEPILAEWVRFARSLGVGVGLSRLSLLNHSAELLLAIAADMATQQNAAQRLAKAEGHADVDTTAGGIKDVSAFHAISRVESGFDLLQMVAEYRALRSSVLELWRVSKPVAHLGDLEEVGRFNEAVDQALAEAVKAFSGRMRRSSDLFLAVLGHDMRGPLHSISMLAQLAEAECEDKGKVSASTQQIVATVESAAKLLDDLLIFTSTRLGAGLPITRSKVNVAALCREAIAEVKAAYPSAPIRLMRGGARSGENGAMIGRTGGSEDDLDFTGDFDPGRLRQAIVNLVRNAVQHGLSASEIIVRLHCGLTSLTLSVHNSGRAIDADLLPTIFDPLVRGHIPNPTPMRRAGSVGLGLYIVREVVHAHGGVVRVESSDAVGTTFIAVFPFQSQRAASFQQMAVVAPN